MPTISIFFGITIYMYFDDAKKHQTPHIHAKYQGEKAVYSIKDGKRLIGKLPSRAHKILIAWIEIYREDLLANWDLAKHKLPIIPIKGLER